MHRHAIPTTEVFVSQLRHKLQSSQPKLILNSSKRAHVAAIFCSTTQAPEKVQLLFVRRAVSESDRWSGQMAFPGGRQEIGRETDLETAIRETKEEIGLDLTQPNVTLLGRLSDRSGGRDFSIGTFAFLYKAATPPALTLAKNEISDAVWVDLEYLLLKPEMLHRMNVPTDLFFKKFIKKYPITKNILRLLQIHIIQMPCVYLPRSNNESSTSSSPSTPREMNDFVLWGLTLGMTSDLVKVAGHPGFKYISATAGPRHYASRIALLAYNNPWPATVTVVTVTALTLAGLFKL